MMNKEIWKDVEGYNGIYQVSNKGRFRSLRNRGGAITGKYRIINSSIDSKGYIQVYMTNRHGGKLHLLSRVLAKTFLPNPEDKPEVNHIDGNPLNNDISNLEWCTRSENTQHAYDEGLNKGCRGEKSGKSKLTRKQVLDIRNAYRLGCFTYKEIADAYGVSFGHVGKIINNKIWAHL